MAGDWRGQGLSARRGRTHFRTHPPTGHQGSGCVENSATVQGKCHRGGLSSCEWREPLV